MSAGGSRADTSPLSLFCIWIWTSKCLLMCCDIEIYWISLVVLVKTRLQPAFKPEWVDLNVCREISWVILSLIRPVSSTNTDLHLSLFIITNNCSSYIQKNVLSPCELPLTDNSSFWIWAISGIPNANVPLKDLPAQVMLDEQLLNANCCCCSGPCLSESQMRLDLKMWIGMVGWGQFHASIHHQFVWVGAGEAVYKSKVTCLR